MNLITGAALARLWGCSRERVAQLARTGRIVPVQTAGRVRLFSPDTVRPGKLKPGRKTDSASLSATDQP